MRIFNHVSPQKILSLSILWLARTNNSKQRIDRLSKKLSDIEIIHPEDMKCFLPPHDLKCGKCPIFHPFFNQCSLKSLNDISTSLETISAALENQEDNDE